MFSVCEKGRFRYVQNLYFFVDNEKKPGNKFFYQNKKQKSNPWSSFENDEFSTSSNGKQHVHSSNFNSLKSSELASVRNNSSK